MARIFFGICLALFSLSPARAAQRDYAKSLGDLPFDITAGVNSDGKLAASFSIPVSLIDQFARTACVSGGMKLVDNSAPVVSVSGGDIIISNIDTEMGQPHMVLTPFSGGRNVIGFTVKDIDVGGSALWVLAKALGITEEMVFDKLMRKMEADFSSGLPAAMSSEVPNPQQLLKFSHDAASRTVYLSLANAFALPAMLRMEFEAVKLEDGVISLGVNSVETADEMAANGYVFALDSRSFSGLLAKILNQRDADGKVLHSISQVRTGYPDQDIMRVSGYKVLSSIPVFFRDNKPLEIAYSADIYVYVPEPNVICLEVRHIDVTWWGTEYNSFILEKPYGVLSLDYVQKALINMVTDEMSGDSTMREMATVSKLNPGTVAIKIKRGAVLPALSRYVDITGVHMERGLAFLYYKLNFSK